MLDVNHCESSWGESSGQNRKKQQLSKSPTLFCQDVEVRFVLLSSPSLVFFVSFPLPVKAGFGRQISPTTSPEFLTCCSSSHQEKLSLSLTHPLLDCQFVVSMPSSTPQVSWVQTALVGAKPAIVAWCSFCFLENFSGHCLHCGFSVLLGFCHSMFREGVSSFTKMLFLQLLLLILFKPFFF